MTLALKEISGTWIVNIANIECDNQLTGLKYSSANNI